MNSLKDGLHFLSAILLLAMIGVIVWYVLFYLRGPEISTGGTLVEQAVEIAELWASDGGKLVVW